MPTHQGVSNTGRKVSSQGSLFPLETGQIVSLDFRLKKLAAYLDKQRYIYAVHGALDGVNLSYTSFKYGFDLAYTESSTVSADNLHEWLTSPLGIIIASLGSMSLIAFSVLGSYLGRDYSNVVPRNISSLWPYFRDIIKSLKISYKGWRNFTIGLERLGIDNFNVMLLPIIIALGGISVMNQIWYRQMKDKRKAKQARNLALIQEILNCNQLTSDNIVMFKQNIQKVQAKEERNKALLSAGISGLVVGLYVYVGLFTLAALSVPGFMAIFYISIVYVALSVLTQIAEEYEYQKKLAFSQLEVELMLSMKTLLEELNQVEHMQQLSSNRLLNPEENQLFLKRIQDIRHHKEAFIQLRKQYQTFLSFSFGASLLLGLNHGVKAYGVVSSLLFALSTIFMLTATTFPPLLLFLGMGFGIALFIVFTAQNLYVAYNTQKQQPNGTTNLSNEIESILTSMTKMLDERRSPSPQESICQPITMDQREDNLEIHACPSPVNIINQLQQEGIPEQEKPKAYFVQEWFDVFRSFFSGLGKASKSVDFSMSPLQQMHDDGHYHDTPIMFIVTAISSLFYSICAALQSHAKGFGKYSQNETILLPLQGSEERIDTSNQASQKAIPVLDIQYSQPIQRYCAEQDVNPPPTDHVSDTVKKMNPNRRYSISETWGTWFKKSPPLEFNSIQPACELIMISRDP